MAVDIEAVKRLKELSGAGITDAKKALEETDGDFDKALEAMRVKGLAKADKKAEREARCGLVDAYVHSGRIGVLVEINCETDFVAKTDEFKTLTHDIAMHVAASAPRYLSAADVPRQDEQKERELIAQELANEGKSEDMIDKISDGKIKKWQSEVCLLQQPFIKNPDQNVGEYIKEHIAKLGENIVVRRFERVELGQVGD